MINERIITCINLFNSCNEVEKYIDKLIELAKRVHNLPDDEMSEILKYKTKKTFTKEEKETEWYKILEEIKKISRPSSDDFQKMIISLSALLISLNKESIIEKDGNKSLSILVDTPSYKEILNHFCIKKNNNYYIDEIEFTSHLECLDFIRNKLLHGDYHIKDDEIYLKKDGKVGKVKFSKLVNYSLVLGGLTKCKEKELESSMVLCSPYTGGALSPLTTITERMFYVDFKITVKGSRTINSSIIKLLNDIEDMAHYFNIERHMFISDSVESAIKTYEDELKENKCNIEYNIDYYIKKTNSREVIAKFLKEYKKIKFNYGDSLNVMVDYLTSNTFYSNKDNLNKSFQTLTYQLLRNMPNAVADLLRHDAPDDAFTEEYGKELPFSILKFYCYFNYGLDKIYSSAKDTLLRDILNGNKFDYSLLDLSLFEDSNMTEEITINNYNDQLMGIINEYNKKEASYKKALGDYNNYLTKTPTPNPVVEAKLLSICKTQKDIFDEIKELKDKADNFDVVKYTKNLNIINHLRNSIAHGNYELDDSDIDNKYFIFNDIYNGVNTYTLKIKCEDFSRLFDSKNKMHDYLEKLSINYFGKSMERIHMEELLLDSIYVKEDCITSWNSLVTSVLDSSDENEIKKIMITYNCMKEIDAPSVYINNKEKYDYASAITISRIFADAEKQLGEFETTKLNGHDVSPKDYEDIIRNILTYSKGVEKYYSVITDELLPLCEKGSVLDNIYNGKNKIR